MVSHCEFGIRNLETLTTLEKFGVVDDLGRSVKTIDEVLKASKDNW